MVKYADRKKLASTAGRKPLPLAQVGLSDDIRSLDDVVAGYKAGRVLAAALELGLFDWLQKHGPSGREKISRALKVNGMYAKSFLQALVDMGVLAVDGKEYENTALASGFLTRDGELYQGDYLLSALGMESKWCDLKSTITAEDPSIEAPVDGRHYVGGVLQRSLRGELQAAAGAVLDWNGAAGARTLLTVGDDHGALAMALCQALPELEADVLDTQDHAKAVKAAARLYGVGDRIKIKKGDVFDGTLGGYDIAVASHFLYRYRDDLPCALFRLAGCLKPGGLFVSDHWFCSPGCVVTSGLQELDKGVSCLGHPLCGVEEFPDALVDAGLEPIGVVDAPGAYGVSKLHMAIRGASKKSSRKKAKVAGAAVNDRC